MSSLYHIEIWNEYSEDAGKNQWIAACTICDYASGDYDTLQEAEEWANAHVCEGSCGCSD